MKSFFKYIFFVVTLFFMVDATFAAKTVSYLHRPLAAEGCEVTYSVSVQDSVYYIVVSVSSDRLFFLENPTMKIRTFKNEVITLKGTIVGNLSKSSGVMIGNVFVPSDEVTCTAQFVTTPEQFEMLKHGVTKIRISMTPMNHEREFKSDVIGKKLYQFFLNEKANEDF